MASLSQRPGLCLLCSLTPPILDPALGLTESECIVRAKNYTLTQANNQGHALPMYETTAPLEYVKLHSGKWDTWHFCEPICWHTHHLNLSDGLLGCCGQQ